MLVFRHLFLGNGHPLGGKVIVDIVDLPGSDPHIARGFDGRAVVVNHLRTSRHITVIIELAANHHVAAAVDQRVVTVIERIGGDTHPFASGQRGGFAVGRQVVEGDGVDADGVAVDTPGPLVSQGVGINPRIAAVDQAVVGQCAGNVEAVFPGADLPAFGVRQVTALQIKLLPRQQFTAVSDITRRGDMQGVIGDNRATVSQAAVAVQAHIPQRQQIAVAADAPAVHIQPFARFGDPAGIQQIQLRAVEGQVACRCQRAVGIIQQAAIGDGERFIRQDHAALVIVRAGVECG